MWHLHLTEESEDVAVLDDIMEAQIGDPAVLVVYNDDVNTFDWVIECFIQILRHSQEQSEQLALIIHSKGRATVKTAPKSTLLPLREALVDRGLSAVVEELV